MVSRSTRGVFSFVRRVHDAAPVLHPFSFKGLSPPRQQQPPFSARVGLSKDNMNPFVYETRHYENGNLSQYFTQSSSSTLNQLQREPDK